MNQFLIAWRSTHVAVVSALTLALASGTACSELSHGSVSPTGPSLAVTVTKVAIEGQGTLSVGQTAEFAAFVTRGDGSREDITAQAQWNADAPDIASVSRGVVLGVNAGGTRITATYDSTAGQMMVTVAELATPAGPVTIPTPAPNPNPVPIAEPTPMPVPVPTPVPTPVPVPVPVPTPVPIPVPIPTPVPPLPTMAVALTVTGNGNLTPGATSQLTATAKLTDGSHINVTSAAAWSSSNPLLATVSPGGNVSALLPGVGSITATYQETSGQAPLQITAPPLVLQGRTITGR